MDKFRKSFRSSFRKKKDDIPPSAAVKQWPQDRDAVRTNTCSFPVKYLGCVEVFEGRGLHICEEAIKLMKNSKRRPIKGSLHVSCDGLKLVDASTQGLVVDQTIEKVSFCSPDRNFWQGFSYICRDGLSKRWMCHGFMAAKDTGERLSHAVGCAFAICLENKQKRDRECSVTMNFDSDQSTFTRFGSFRQGSFMERLQDPQTFKPAEPIAIAKDPVSNPHAVSRPRVSSLMYERATSMRGRGRLQLSGSSPFKRQASLRLSELPSMLERQDNLTDSENLSTNVNIRTTKISPLPGYMASPGSDFSPIQEKEAVTARLAFLTCSETILPSSVDSNMFSLSVSQPSITGQIVHDIKTDHPLKLKGQQFSPNSLIGSLPTSNTSFTTPPACPSIDSASSLKPPVSNQSLIPSGSNPWENVPDQFHIRRCDSTAAPQTKLDKNVSTGSFPPKRTESVATNNVDERKGFSHVNSSTAIDPFDTEWAETVVRTNGESEIGSNPFRCSQTIEAFKIQM